jgi:hypothetical protein
MNGPIVDSEAWPRQTSEILAGSAASVPPENGRRKARVEFSVQTGYSADHAEEMKQYRQRKREYDIAFKVWKRKQELAEASRTLKPDPMGDEPEVPTMRRLVFETIQRHFFRVKVSC